MGSDDVNSAPDAFPRVVADRFGVLPNFFCSAPAAPGLIEELWAFAKSAYLDNPLPPVFKERLFVHLSRFCEVRYCIVRHVGFLMGEGRPAGDATAEPHTIQQVLTLLRRPVPDAAALDAALFRLESRGEAAETPMPETQDEADLFDALTLMFLAPARSARARRAVRTSLGERRFEILTAFLAFVRTAHYWTETHPELAYEPDMFACMESHPELAALLLDASEAVGASAAVQLRETLGALDQTQDALRASEERFRQFGEASSDVLWVRDAETLQWEYLSPAFEEIYGLGRDEALTGDNFRNWVDLILPEDRERAIADIGRVKAGENVTFEYRVCRPKNGQVRWLRNTDFPMRDATGRVVRVGGIGQDVTELKAVQAAVAASEERLRTLAEGIPQLVWRSFDKGQWTWSSPQWQTFTGQSQEKSHGRGWLDALHPDDRDRTMRAWDEAQPQGKLDVEHRVRRAADGAYLWHHTRSLPVHDAVGGIVEWLGTSTDVHKLRELQQRQKVLVAELQHRTRNLMGVVRSVADKTINRSADLADFKLRYAERLTALARVQGLLSRLEEWDRVTFDELIRSELTAINGHGEAAAVTLEGPKGWRCAPRRCRPSRWPCMS